MKKRNDRRHLYGSGRCYSAQTLMGLWIVGDICSCELRRQLKDLLLRVSRQGREKVGDKGQVVQSCSH